MFLKKRKNETIKAKREQNESTTDFILPLYLNQRFVYDILAIKNNGFTEFFEIRDKTTDSNELAASINAKFGTNNEFSLIQASTSSGIKTSSVNDTNNEKSYKKTHTPTSLFMQVYQYLNENKKIKNLVEVNDIESIDSGDFVEIKSNIELNTIVEFFETFDKLIDISEAFSSFADSTPQNKQSMKSFSNMKKSIEKTLKVLLEGENNVKYGICKLEEKEIVVKLNKEYFINGDYSEIKNGKFRIIGKVLEVIPEGENILLNRENAVGLYDPKTFKDVKEAFNSIQNINFKEFKDVVKGKTIVIMPIAIGI